MAGGKSVRNVADGITISPNQKRCEHMKIPVSELIVKYMEMLGIEYIFGMPGAHILPVYDSLHQSSVKSVLAKHEQGAAFMACGCARASGRISACIATAGPGATNLVTPAAYAQLGAMPMLMITGQKPIKKSKRGRPTW